jgi:hypothetical protein
MVVLYVVLSLAVVFLIAAVVIGREAHRLDAVPPRAVFDLDEATEWVGNHLPFSVSAVLSFADVRQVLEWSLDFLRAKGLAADPPTLAGSMVVGPDEVAEYVRRQARAAGLALAEDQITVVLDVQFGYFDAIGAIGREALPDELPDDLDN